MRLSHAFSDEQVEVDFRHDSFDTHRMNVQDSVASELDFNHENASIGDEDSANENEDTAIDMNNLVNMSHLNKSKTSIRSHNTNMNVLQRQITQLKP